MPTRRKGGKCMRIALVIYTPLLWLAGMAMIFLGIWMLVDPRRTYILDIVNFSEDDPLLVFAAYVSISAGIASLIVGFVSCCAALKRMRCMLATLILCLLVLFLCGIAIGILALIFRDKFPNEDRLRVYLTNMTHNRYSRDKWVMPLLDTIQFYQQCCGGTSGMDYKDSFWYITNTERGTISFVPRSCCRQTQAARAWNIQPVDPLCNTYDYRQSTYQLNVHDEGCAPKLYKWFNEQTAIFAAFGFTFAGLQVIGIIIALLLCSNIRYYYEYVKEDDY